MDQSYEPAIESAKRIAVFAHEIGAHEPVALDISRQSSFADALVVASATSHAQIRGFQRQLQDCLAALDLEPRAKPRRDDESGWIILDCDSVVVHLMMEEQRSFYELERIWFDSPAIVDFRAGGSPEALGSDDSQNK